MVYQGTSELDWYGKRTEVRIFESGFRAYRSQIAHGFTDGGISFAEARLEALGKVRPHPLLWR